MIVKSKTLLNNDVQYIMKKFINMFCKQSSEKQFSNVLKGRICSDIEVSKYNDKRIFPKYKIKIF
jgi:hypothetical protein